MRIKDVVSSVAYQIFPSILGVYYFHITPKQDGFHESYYLFYVIGAISLVKLISDFGVSRSFIKIYINSAFDERILSVFFKIYFSISLVVFFISSVISIFYEEVSFLLSVSLFFVGLSVYFDNLLISRGMLKYQYLVDSLYFSIIYGFSIVFLDVIDEDEILIMLFFASLMQLYLKAVKVRISFSSVVRYKFFLENKEWQEFKYSMSSSLWIASYKLIDRLILIYILPPVFYSFYQVVSQIINKIVLFPQLLSKQMLILFSSKKKLKIIGSRDFKIYYSIIEIYNIAFLGGVKLFSVYFLELVGFYDDSSKDILLWLGIAAIYATSSRYLRSYIVGLYGGKVLVKIDFQAGLAALLVGFFVLILKCPEEFYLISAIIYYFYIFSKVWFYIIREERLPLILYFLIFLFELIKLFLIVL